MTVTENKSFVHRYNPGITCIVLAETAKGWKVKQRETFASTRKTPKEIIQYYHRIDFDTERGIWKELNN